MHAIVQGIDKRYIFDKDIYKQKYKDLIYENSEKFNVSILAFCIMNNHTHLCLYSENIQNVSKFMHKTNSSYANYYNYLENRVGYVFRNRYYSKEIRNRQQLFNTISYIHKNPIKSRLVNEISEWKYSTYNDYINYRIPIKNILLVFENEDYIETFNKIHTIVNDSDIFDVDEDFEPLEEIVTNFLHHNKISLQIVKKEKNLLYELIKELKYKGKVLNKDISKKLNINKNTVTKMIKDIR